MLTRGDRRGGEEGEKGGGGRKGKVTEDDREDKKKLPSWVAKTQPPSLPPHPTPPMDSPICVATAIPH
jgi:hypothetical protein